jgi:hypothetical protein
MNPENTLSSSPKAETVPYIDLVSFVYINSSCTKCASTLLVLVLFLARFVLVWRLVWLLLVLVNLR